MICADKELPPLTTLSVLARISTKIIDCLQAVAVCVSGCEDLVFS
jgi:hypothetical protein